MKRLPYFLFAAMSVSGALGLIYEGIVRWILLRICVKIPDMEAASIGIIGGADGPTAVFLTGAPSSIAEPVLFVLLLAAGLIGLICLKRIRKS